MDLADLDPKNPNQPTTYDESEVESAGVGVAKDCGNGWDREGEEGNDD